MLSRGYLSPAVLKRPGSTVLLDPALFGRFRWGVEVVGVEVGDAQYFALPEGGRPGFDGAEGVGGFALARGGSLPPQVG